MSTYLYQAVSGGGLWGSPGSIGDAKKLARSLRPRFPEVEVERVMLLDNNAQRYWRWRKRKWTTEFWTNPTASDLEKWL